MRKRTLLAAAAMLLLPLGVGVIPLQAAGGSVGAVYTMTNDPMGNQVLVYERLADGALQPAEAFAFDTGGLGSGDSLGSQGAVVLSDDGRWLLAVNAGSDELSVFAVARGGLLLTDTIYSGGARPVSVTARGNLVYVVHDGGSVGEVDGIQGFRRSPRGKLTPIPGSGRPLSGPATSPAQIGFSPNGGFLLVTEKATSSLVVFHVNRLGVAGPPMVSPSAGQTPFALAFGKRDQVFVSEVFGGADDGGAVSSYRLRPGGVLETIDPSVPNMETAPCWLVASNSGRFLFTTNTPDDSLSAYEVGFEGRLTLVDEDGRSGEPGSGTRPLDMDLSDDGRFLYTLNIGDGTISTFRVGADGSLIVAASVDDVPAGVVGMAAR